MKTKITYHSAIPDPNSWTHLGLSVQDECRHHHRTAMGALRCLNSLSSVGKDKHHTNQWGAHGKILRRVGGVRSYWGRGDIEYNTSI